MAELAKSIMVGSTILNANSQLNQGNAAQTQAYSQASQLESMAGQTRATAQRSGIEQRRQAKLAQSALLARAGGGAGDIGVINLDKGIQGEGEYRALSALFQGEEEARSKEVAAANARTTGDAAAQAGKTRAFSSILTGASSLFSKYGGGGPNEWGSGSRYGNRDLGENL